MEAKKIIVSGFEELRNIIKEGKISLENIDIKISNINSFRDYTQKKGLFEGIDFKNINGTIKDWDISNITDLSNTFKETKNIPYDELSNWNTSNVESMFGIFIFSDFDGDISKWNTSKVKDLTQAFAAGNFNGDISNWDTSNVERLEFTFKSSKFNKDISKWNTSKVKNMHGTFGFSEFNGDLSNWSFDNVENAMDIFYKSKIDTSNLVEKFNIKKINGDLIQYPPIKDVNGLEYDYTIKDFNQLKTYLGVR